MIHHPQKENEETTTQFSGISPNVAMTSLCFLQEMRRAVTPSYISNWEIIEVIWDKSAAGFVCLEYWGSKKHKKLKKTAWHPEHREHLYS